MSAPATPVETEATEAGPQTLIAGVRPLSPRDRLAVLADAPLAPSVRQKRCDLGLFDMESRRQTDLIDALRTLERAERKFETPTPTPSIGD